MKADRGLTIERMVELGRVSRSGFYRFDDAEPGPDRDMELRDAIQKIAVEWPCYGRPRITKELRRRGWAVNPKRVRRLMREDNLLCVRKRKFVVTTDSNHGRKIYPNLARRMILTGTDQLWAADITYIRLRDEFVFLAVILDAHSRRVIGWALDRTLEDELTLGALRMALARHIVEPGLVHHSDRGTQYASKPGPAWFLRSGYCARGWLNLHSHLIPSQIDITLRCTCEKLDRRMRLPLVGLEPERLPTNSLY